MEPGHEDREYRGPSYVPGQSHRASMEPGHEDREYGSDRGMWRRMPAPQWSPVMKTGNTTPTPDPRAEFSCLNGARS